MTLCIIWREGVTINFVSDSRLSFGDALVSDFGIKICRVPFNIYGAAEKNGEKPLITSGDLGFAFAGSALGALVIKEALSELVREMQGIEGHHETNMDGLSHFIFKSYESISKEVCATLFEKGLTCVVFSGYCMKQQKYRTFRMETNEENKSSIIEVLIQNNFEVIGNGSSEAKWRLPKSNVNEIEVVNVLRHIIGDESIADVGGNIQFGSFYDDHRFQPAGVLHVNADGNVNYWRGPLDLNATYFNDDGLIPNFPLRELS